MKKVLLFLRENSIAPKGGPSGYVFNLLKGLPESESISISLLPPAPTNSKKRKWYDSLPVWIKRIYRVYGHYKEYRHLSQGYEDVTEEYLAQFDAVHFHSCLSLYAHLNVLKNYNGLVFLTSHSPKPPHIEMIEDFYSKFERFLYGKKHLKKYEKAVIAAYERADAIIYPCKEAEESYYNNWNKYVDIRKRIEQKIFFLPTGVDSCKEKVALTRDEVCEKYNIPKDAFIVAFVGRHNEVKGYDLLKSIASHFTEESNVYFLIAGEESPLKRPKLSYWKEAGWTKDPYSIESAADLFILPNKETYFDLVLLEVLSIGTPVLTTYTGGNKFFAKFDSEIYYFTKIEEAVETIEKMKNKECSGKNRTLFLNHFTAKKFGENYISTLDNIFLINNKQS